MAELGFPGANAMEAAWHMVEAGEFIDQNTLEKYRIDSDEEVGNSRSW